jgi:hypothetical protein
LESIRTYQAEELGRHGGSSLLYELMPIPKPNIGSWVLNPHWHRSQPSADMHRGQGTLVEGFENRRTLLCPDKKASAVIDTD